MLNLTQNLCTLRGWSFLRLDGSTAIETRQSSINRFNTEADETFVFFLSTKAGGVGLNLTGAHRLILIDYDWNPATDDQAMARIWRQGQSKKIFVYRLISDCTLEMYMKKVTVEKCQLHRYVML